MASGGLRFDLTKDEGLTIGEKRTLKFAIEDGDAAPIDDFSNWEFEFFILQALWSANGLTALRAAAVVHKEDADITATTPPDVTVPLSTADWPPSAKTWAYELWRVDAAQPSRLAYGEYVVVH